MNRIKELRTAANKSQAALAADLSVAQNTISQWENGNRDIDSDKLHILADYFNVTIDYFLGRSNDATPPNAKSPVYDDEALEMMEEMHKRPELKVLFNTTRKVKKEDIEFIDQMVKRMAGEYRD